jgi:dolichyl-diphosphooligosaccharide--protein glycosyltransferase
MKRRYIEIIICAILLALIFTISLCLRISLPWSEVFGSNTVKLTDNDAYFYVRLMDNLCAHFPTLGNFDPYYIYPSGKDLAGQPLFFVYFMGFFAWLLGGGAPSQQSVDLVGAYFPAVLGALMVFPVFLLARALFNKWAGLAAALLITLMPGEFLVRTLLGNADSHVMEIFFTTLFMLFLLLGANKGRELKFLPLADLDHGGAAVLLVYLALAGLCLGIYIASWTGAVLFVLISLIWLALQFVSDHLRNVDTLYLGVSGVMVYTVALLISLSAGAGMLTIVALSISIFISAALTVLSGTMTNNKLKAINFLYAAAGLAVVSIVALLIAMPGIMNYLQTTLAELTGKGIAETQPLLMQDGKFTLALVWGNYTAASLLALAALVIVCYRGIKDGLPGILMLAVWSIIILAATLAMRRFAYYLAVDIAVLSGLSCWLILKSCGFSEISDTVQPAAAARKEVKKSARKEKRKPAVSTANAGLMALGAIVVLMLTVYPNTGPLPGGDRPFFDVSTRALFAPSDAWCDSLKWLREKSPEPFGDAGYYYRAYSGEHRQAAYSVLTWWDYGYWVTRIGHRVPVCNPGDQLKGAEKFFTEQKPEQASALGTNWKAKYMIVDDYMVNWQKGFKAIAYAAGKQQSHYYEIYYRQQNEGLAQALLYYPEYYQTMAVRLYCFEGRKYVPQENAVISWEQQTGTDGRPIKMITGLKTFRSYSEAADFVAAQKSGNWRIVGKDPLVSPVPLDALPGYSTGFNSSQKSKVGNSEISTVKIFEYDLNAGQHE